MIVLYSGTPGSGKSLHQASDVYWRIRTGKPTIANYAINTSAVKGRGEFLQVDNAELSPQLLRDYANQYYLTHRFAEGSIALYIDEAQLLFNCRDNNLGVDRKAWIDFFTQHRKYGFNIYLIAQFDRMLDRQIRSLIEYEYIHRKVSNFGWRGWILLPFVGNHCYVKVWYPMKEKVGAEFFRVRKRYYRLYDSYKDFGHKKPGGDPDEVGASESVPLCGESDPAARAEDLLLLDPLDRKNGPCGCQGGPGGDSVPPEDALEGRI